MWVLWVTLIVTTACGRWGFDQNRNRTDDATVGNDAVDAFVDRPNRIFMSTAMFEGALGGLAGADMKCQTAADAKGFGGVWKAVLQSSVGPPSGRFAGSRGWVDPTGRVIADQPASLDFAINPLHVDENGTEISLNEWALWGSPDSTCNDWTSSGGAIGSLLIVVPTASFQGDSFASCNNVAHLICAETGHVAAATPPIETGRVAFITTAAFSPGGGVAAADAVCQAEAVAVGLPSTMLAFLATPSVTAEARFSGVGAPWRRVDGVRITQTAAALVGPQPVAVWDSFIGRTANNQPTGARVWTGTQSQNCNNWNSGLASQSGSIGNSNSTQRQRLQLFSNVLCNSTGFRLICLEP